MDNLIDSVSLVKEIYNSTYDYGIFTCGLDGKINTWNVGAERITGFLAREVIGQDNAIIFTPEDLARDEPRQEMHIAKTTGRATDYRWHQRKDGSRFWADGVLTLIHDESGRHVGYLKIFRDLTDRKLAEAELHRIANSDMLTGLPNRFSFETHLEEMISMACRSGRPMALHLIDLDRFKQVNDTLGHHSGDLLLQQTAHRMRRVLRDSDFIARLGGDEFVLLQPNLPVIRASTDLAVKLNTILSQPFDIGGHEVQVGASIGIAICPADAIDSDQLLKKADLALYRAKAEGKGKFHYFTEKLDSAAHRRNRELIELRGAVERNEFWVAYQPKVAFSTGETFAMEALLRCSNPLFADYSIERIVDLASESGLMKNLGHWVLRQTCAQLREWNEGGLRNLTVCVNMCAHELRDQETPEHIEALLWEMGLAPSSLEVEITERQALDIERYGLSILNALRSRGIKIALDDFGTGYSALSYLRNLPVTAVKLDKSFLIGIPHDVQGRAVIKAVMDISNALGLETIAEGVETEEQAAFLRENNCPGFQGFLVSRPLSAGEMTAWLKENNGTWH